jgi:hypothetical protein
VSDIERSRQTSITVSSDIVMTNVEPTLTDSIATFAVFLYFCLRLGLSCPQQIYLSISSEMSSPPRKPSPILTASDYIPMKLVDGHPIRIDKSQKKKDLGAQSDFYRPSIGQQIGIDNRYIVLRKLGMGNHSTVCLVKDQLDM